jgi:hypothetical protein
VYKVVVVNLFDYLLDITALSEPETQASANHVYVTTKIGFEWRNLAASCRVMLMAESGFGVSVV